MLIFSFTSSSSFYLEDNSLPEGKIYYKCEVNTNLDGGNFEIKATIKSIKCLESIANYYLMQTNKENIHSLLLELNFNGYFISKMQIESFFKSFGRSIYHISLKNVAVDLEGAIAIIDTREKGNISFENLTASDDTYEYIIKEMKHMSNNKLILNEPSDEVISILLEELNDKNAQFAKLVIRKKTMPNSTITKFICQLQNNKQENLTLLNEDNSDIKIKTLRMCLKQARENDNQNIPNGFLNSKTADQFVRFFKFVLSSQYKRFTPRKDDRFTVKIFDK